jgi:tetratricopeptide (TPR) repeat protein
MNKLALVLLLVLLLVPVSAKEPAENNAQSETSTADQSIGVPANTENVNTVDDTAGGATYKINHTTSLQDVRLNTALKHYYLAQHYIRRLDFNLAEVELQQAILYTPSLKVAHRDLSLVSLVQLKPLKALAEFLLAVGLYDALPATPFEKAELDARAAKLHYAKALSYGKVNRWNPAIAELKRAKRYTPDNLAIERSLAFAYASNGQFDLAEKQYELSFANNDPEDAYYHADFAYLLAKEGKQDSALAQINKAVALKPDVPALHLDLAWFFENKGDLARASKEIKEAVKLSPNHAGLWAHLGRLLEKTGQSQEAKASYAKALSLDPKLAEAKDKFWKLE